MRAALSVIAVAFLFVGGLLFTIGGRSLVEAWRYRQAVRIDAIATSTALRPATEDAGTAYELSYRATIERRVLERKETVPVHLWEQVKPGTVVHVEHLPGDPESVRAVTGEPGVDTQSIIFTAIGAVLSLGGLFAASRAMRRPPPAESPEPVEPVVMPVHEDSFWPLARRSSEFYLGAMFLVVTTPIVAATMLGLVQEWRFVRDGVSTDAMVLTKEIVRSGRGNRTRSYEATYRFTVPEGAFEHRSRLPLDAWSRLTERQPAEVVYLPERPAASRLTDAKRPTELFVMAPLGAVFFAIGATCFRRSIRQARLEWRLRHRGAAAEGSVIEVSDRHLAINGVRQWRLHYEYRDFQGRRHTGTHDLPEDEAAHWRAGDTGAVRYDPARPADVIWSGNR
jgi:hypothetical protein